MIKKTHSIDWLYAKLDKHIKLVEAYSEVKDLEFIIKACRLKPIDYAVKEQSNKIDLIREWFDEFGNSFSLKKKVPYIVYNDLHIDRNKLICTDLYNGIALCQIAKISKSVFLIAGKDEDQYEDSFLLSFYGIDGYLRAYLFLYGEWQQISPLLLGIKNLQLFKANLDAANFMQLNKKESLLPPCKETETWISCLPAQDEFLAVVKKKYERLLPILDPK
jgi:hypothetical protein